MDHDVLYMFQIVTTVEQYCVEYYAPGCHVAPRVDLPAPATQPHYRHPGIFLLLVQAIGRFVTPSRAIPDN